MPLLLWSLIKTLKGGYMGYTGTHILMLVHRLNQARTNIGRFLSNYGLFA